MTDDESVKTVRRDAEGQVVKGSGAINPGGLNVAQRHARDAAWTMLCREDMRTKGFNAYGRLLDADNPAVVLDFMNRIAGKVKEHVAVTDEDGNPLAAFNGKTFEQILDYLSKLKR